MMATRSLSLGRCLEAPAEGGPKEQKTALNACVPLENALRSFARRCSGPWSPHSQEAKWLSLPLQSETKGISRRGCFEPSIPASGFVFAKVEHSELQSWITTASFQALGPGPCIVTTCLSPQSTSWKRSMHFHSTHHNPLTCGLELS